MKETDKRHSHRAKAVFCLVLLLLGFVPNTTLNAYYVTYKEQWYRLYHVHYNHSPDDAIENIYYLERALHADFSNPLYALALIENEIQWEKYRYLFMMQINLKLIEQYLQLGNSWNKRNAYFYNAPWREINLEALEITENTFKTALYYWDDAVQWALKAREPRFRFVRLQRAQYWEDQAYRIENNLLNYQRIINRELTMLQQVRERFEAMDESTY